MRRHIRFLSCVAILLRLGCVEAQQPPCAFKFGVVSKQGIDLNGNNLYLDSFDSIDPAKSTNGLYDATKKQANGNLALGGSVTDSLTNLANANIYGYVFTGPTSTVTIGTSGSIGPTFASPATDVAGAMTNGWLRSDCSIDVSDVILPIGASLWSTLGSINNTGTINGGDWRATGIFLNGAVDKLTIQGNVRLYVVGNVSLSGNGMILISPGASLELYVAGNVFIGGNGVVNLTGRALSNRFYGLATSTSWSINGNGTWIGVACAPSAAMTLSGGGVAGDMSGMLIGKSIVLNGQTRVHCDESLMVQTCQGIAETNSMEGIVGIESVSNDIVLSFPIYPLKSYLVEYSNEPGTGTWQSLYQTNYSAACTSEVIIVTDPGAADLSQRYYRLRIMP